MEKTDCPKRIAIIGAECTGKTTLAQDLAAHYNTVWVPEYVREFVDRKGDLPVLEDIPLIAQSQAEKEDALAREANRVLLCDTNLIMNAIYSDHYLGSCPQSVMDESRRRTYDLTLVTDTDIPWQADSIQRESPEVRDLLQRKFIDELKARNIPYTLVTGNREARMKTATRAIDALLA